MRNTSTESAPGGTQRYCQLVWILILAEVAEQALIYVKVELLGEMRLEVVLAHELSRLKPLISLFILKDGVEHFLELLIMLSRVNLLHLSVQECIAIFLREQLEQLHDNLWEAGAAEVDLAELFLREVHPLLVYLVHE